LPARPGGTRRVEDGDALTDAEADGLGDADGPAPARGVAAAPAWPEAVVVALPAAPAELVAPSGGVVAPGTPGRGSSAFGGTGPPRKLRATTTPYAVRTVTTATEPRRIQRRRLPEVSTKTGFAWVVGRSTGVAAVFVDKAVFAAAVDLVAAIG